MQLDQPHYNRFVRVDLLTGREWEKGFDLTNRALPGKKKRKNSDKQNTRLELEEEPRPQLWALLYGPLQHLQFYIVLL